MASYPIGLSQNQKSIDATAEAVNAVEQLEQVSASFEQTLSENAQREEEEEEMEGVVIVDIDEGNDGEDLDRAAECGDDREKNDDCDNDGSLRKRYQVITQEVREKFIERVISKRVTIKEAAREFGLKFSTSKAILHTYKKEGRIGKKKTRERKRKFACNPNQAVPCELAQHGNQKLQPNYRFSHQTLPTQVLNGTLNTAPILLENQIYVPTSQMPSQGQIIEQPYMSLGQGPEQQPQLTWIVQHQHQNLLERQHQSQQMQQMQMQQFRQSQVHLMYTQQQSHLMMEQQRAMQQHLQYFQTQQIYQNGQVRRCPEQEMVENPYKLDQLRSQITQKQDFPSSEINNNVFAVPFTQQYSERQQIQIKGEIKEEEGFGKKSKLQQEQHQHLQQVSKYPSNLKDFPRMSAEQEFINGSQFSGQQESSSQQKNSQHLMNNVFSGRDKYSQPWSVQSQQTVQPPQLIIQRNFQHPTQPNQGVTQPLNLIPQMVTSATNKMVQESLAQSVQTGRGGDEHTGSTQTSQLSNQQSLLNELASVRIPNQFQRHSSYTHSFPTTTPIMSQLGTDMNGINGLASLNVFGNPNDFAIHPKTSAGTMYKTSAGSFDGLKGLNTMLNAVGNQGSIENLQSFAIPNKLSIESIGQANNQPIVNFPGFSSIDITPTNHQIGLAHNQTAAVNFGFPSIEITPSNHSFHLNNFSATSGLYNPHAQTSFTGFPNSIF